MSELLITYLTSSPRDLLHHLLNVLALLELPALHQGSPLSVYQSHKVDGHVPVAIVYGLHESGDNVIEGVNLRTIENIILVCRHSDSANVYLVIVKNCSVEILNLQQIIHQVH